MSSQRYERISGNEDDDSPILPPGPQHPIPSSPPPSFHSRASSPTSQRLLSQEDPLISDADRALADSFGDEGGDGSEGEDEGDDRQRLMRGTGAEAAAARGQGQETTAASTRPDTGGRQVTESPHFLSRRAGSARAYGSGRGVNDGVFANLSAKPEVGEKEEQPPSYEQAAADATPPYWETTILAPGMAGDEVFIDGLPVGSIFSFVWNGMISMSFQLVGFLLTYLLHTTHAAKDGSRAGLGITLVQYGFYMKGSGNGAGGGGADDGTGSADAQYGTPPDPNSHSFNPADAAAAAVASMVGDGENPNPGGSGSGSGLSSITGADWLAYLLMIVGWFILIRAVSDFLRARRHEQLVLQSPDRGLGVPVVAEGEHSETVV
ncbi:MAG: hypothetical protein M1839_008612 [Geoglossum umbratile]|nr:MAG: hypothetical protein M1839_008612 [Geoglossum umbratile]